MVRSGIWLLLLLSGGCVQVTRPYYHRPDVSLATHRVGLDVPPGWLLSQDRLHLRDAAVYRLQSPDGLVVLLEVLNKVYDDLEKQVQAGQEILRKQFPGALLTLVQQSVGGQAACGIEGRINQRGRGVKLLYLWFNAGERGFSIQCQGPAATMDLQKTRVSTLLDSFRVE